MRKSLWITAWFSFAVFPSVTQLVIAQQTERVVDGVNSKSPKTIGC